MGFRICLFPFATVTLVTFRVNPVGNVMLIVSVVTIAVESLKVILAVPILLMVTVLMENALLVRLPAVVPSIFTFVQISIFPPLADCV